MPLTRKIEENESKQCRGTRAVQGMAESNQRHPISNSLRETEVYDASIK